MDSRLVSLYQHLSIPPSIQERLTTEGGVVTLELLAIATPGELIALGVGTVAARALGNAAWEELRKYACRYCVATYKTARGLVAHHNRCHEGEQLAIRGEKRLWLCELCGEYHLKRCRAKVKERGSR